MRNSFVVLDDKPDVSKILRIIKLALGVDPESYKAGEKESLHNIDAIVLKNCRPDVIKLDISISGVDSQDLINKVEGDPLLGRIFARRA